MAVFPGVSSVPNLNSNASSNINIVEGLKAFKKISIGMEISNIMLYTGDHLNLLVLVYAEKQCLAENDSMLALLDCS